MSLWQLSSSLSSRSDVMNTGDLASALPDERPVTSVAVVESITGCPPGFTVVSGLTRAGCSNSHS